MRFTKEIVAFVAIILLATGVTVAMATMRMVIMFLIYGIVAVQ